jgi:aminomethyltransferase
MSAELLHTPLHAQHVEAGAKMVSFAGYDMPVHYPAGILGEHKAVRGAAGLFDVSHMGEFEITGPSALGLVQAVTTNDASKLSVGQAQYSVICKEDGGALDDCIVYRHADRWVMVVNASRRTDDWGWVQSHAAGHDVELKDISDDIALIALQGPKAQSILSRLTDADLDGIAYYHFGEGAIDGVHAIISRTGYTGEDGFELYHEAAAAPRLWNRLLEAGADDGLIPAGLGARDSLRLEVGYALYGNDLDETRTPLEAGLGWVVKPGKGHFIGRDALVKQKEEGVKSRLAGFVLKERGFPRHGYGVRHEGQTVGEVTSGVLSPTLQVGIGLAYLPAGAAKAGTAIEIEIRDRVTPAEVVRPPFYKDGSIRR